MDIFYSDLLDTRLKTSNFEACVLVQGRSLSQGLPKFLSAGREEELAEGRWEQVEEGRERSSQTPCLGAWLEGWTEGWGKGWRKEELAKECSAELSCLGKG